MSSKGYEFRVGAGSDGKTAILAVLMFWVVVAAGTAKADRRITVQNRDYRVYGQTARELVGYMKTRPFRGDYGPAMANVRPSYRLDLKTRQGRGGCRVKSLAVHVRFVVTLPKAIDERRFDRRTRRAWRSFRRFTVRHENVHKRIYLGCIRRFRRGARRTPPMSSCMSLRYHLQRKLTAADKACDRLHRAFDRREFHRVRHLSLFRQARIEKRRGRRRARNSFAHGRSGRALPNWFTSIGRDR